MRIDPAHLKFKALVALDEVLAGGPVTQALRFALAYLYAVGDGERSWFVDFWQAARHPDRLRNDAAGFGKRQTMNASMNGICRSVGVERDVAFDQALRRARGG